jgi:hypothetical protein
MVNFKALFIGIALIMFFGLLFQLFFILAATGYTVVLQDYPQLDTIGQLISYIIGGASYFFIMSGSGYVTASFAEKNISLHTFLIALLTTGISLVTSIREDSYTLNSIIFVIAGIAFSMIGGRIWIRHQRSETLA